MSQTSSPDNLFGQLVRQARERRNLSQPGLGRLVDKTKMFVYGVEKGTTIPSLDDVVRLHSVLVTGAAQLHGPDASGQTEAARTGSLRLWLSRWMQARTEISKTLNEAEKTRMRSAIGMMLEQASHGAGESEAPKSKSLANFPSAFEPLTIVCGDRRESTPQSRGDVFAYSVSVTDLMFLMNIDFEHHPLIKTDKIFSMMDEDYIKSKFGRTNLLIIGSPAVNIAARLINGHSVFRFNLDRHASDWEKNLNEIEQPNLKDANNIEVFWEMSKDPEHINPNDYRGKGLTDREITDLAKIVQRFTRNDDPKRVMNWFRKPGLSDPSDGNLHGESPRQTNDFGLVSLAKNPFADSDEFVCILAAGIHGPGTAHAVRALATDRDELRRRPLGGIIEVRIDQNKDWPSRFEQAKVKWQTEPYTHDVLVSNMRRALATWPPREGGAFENFTRQEIEESIGFVEHIASEL